MEMTWIIEYYSITKQGNHVVYTEYPAYWPKWYVMRRIRKGYAKLPIVGISFIGGGKRGIKGKLEWTIKRLIGLLREL